MNQERRFYKLRDLDETRRAAIIKTIREALSSKKDIVFAYLHGSFAESGPFRDIDVAVYLKNREVSLKAESDLSLELTEKSDFPVEVKIINSAPVSFQMAVLKKGILLLNHDDEQRTDFIEDVSRNYREYAHFRNIVLWS